jgi:hypothetical protein
VSKVGRAAVVIFCFGSTVVVVGFRELFQFLVKFGGWIHFELMDFVWKVKKKG